MRLASICFATVFTVAVSALAADTPLYAKNDCNAVIASAAAFHQCYADNLAAANAALDRLYRQLMSQRVFYIGSRDRLRDVERAWIVYKDKECDYEYGKPAATQSEDSWLAHVDCEIRVTEHRIRELQGRPSCSGGDSICTPHMR
jgi:uncharacterized protein YecT (DUF1311 family)